MHTEHLCDHSSLRIVLGCFALFLFLAPVDAATCAQDAAIVTSELSTEDGEAARSGVDAIVDAEAVTLPPCTTYVPAGTYVNQHWTQAGSPYCIQGDIREGQLTIDPGVIVIFQGHYKLDVLGWIKCLGSREEPVKFTAGSPTYCSWAGITIANQPEGSEFNYCIIEKSDSSGVSITDGASPIFDNCTLRHNSNTVGTGDGGGINAVNVTNDMNLTGCIFLNNTSKRHGGAIHATMNAGKRLTIADSFFRDNAANPSRADVDPLGGALYLENGDCDISRTRFVGNRVDSRCTGGGCDAVARGGAVCFAGGDNIHVDSSEFTGNTTYANCAAACSSTTHSLSYGGGLYVFSGTVTITNTVINCNVSTYAGCDPDLLGSGVYVNGGTVSLVNDTLALNNRTGLYRAGGTVNVKNSILYYNYPTSTGPPPVYGAQVGGTVTITCSDVQGGFTGLGNINLDPQFARIDCESHAVALLPFSPCVDAGCSDGQYNDACFPPSWGSEPNDMGAYGGPGACNWLPAAGEVTGLRFDNKILLRWNMNLVVDTYNVYRGSVNAGPWEYDHVCLAWSVPSLTDYHNDNDNPAMGAGFYYLVIGSNSTGLLPIGYRAQRNTGCAGQAAIMDWLLRPDPESCP